MLAAGLYFVSIPFTSSLSPNARAYASLPRVSVVEMQPASFKFVSDPRGTNNFPVGLLIIKYETGSFEVLNIPFNENIPHVPERWWWKPLYKCPSLQVDFNNKIITCPAGTIPGWPKGSMHAPAFEWTLNGTYQGKESWIPNLEPVPIKMELNNLIIGVQ